MSAFLRFDPEAVLERSQSGNRPLLNPLELLIGQSMEARLTVDEQAAITNEAERSETTEGFLNHRHTENPHSN